MSPAVVVVKASVEVAGHSHGDGETSVSDVASGGTEEGGKHAKREQCVRVDNMMVIRTQRAHEVVDRKEVVNA